MYAPHLMTAQDSTAMIKKAPQGRREPFGLLDARSPCDSCTRSCLAGPERLVGLGFRCWLVGYQTGDIACWEQAWDTFARELGPIRAKTAITELSCWVRTVSRDAQRTITVYPNPCATFCRDECLAVSMIAAHQHGADRDARASAFALLESSMVDDVVATSQAFASVLTGIDVMHASSAIADLASRQQQTMIGTAH